MKHWGVMIVCASALTSCNKPQVHETNASVSEVANAVSSSGVARESVMRPGQWRVSASLEEMSIPGMPPQAQAEMKRVMGNQQNTSYEYCLSPEEAKRPHGKFFGGKEEKNCRYDHFTMGGGKIDAMMTCETDQSRTMTMNVNGTYSPDSYETHVAMNMKGGREGAMTMKMHSEAHRIGECTAKRG